MIPLFQQLFDTSDFPARWACGKWSPEHGWLHILSDIAIFGAYAAIPLALAYFIRRRKDVPFIPIFWLFAVFIFSCGFGHLVEATLFWHPWYRFSGGVKVVTAVFSWLTVIALVKVLPIALALPGLAKINRQLKEEIAERQHAEAEREKILASVAASNRELEQFNKLAVGRELRMIELKREVNELAAACGREPRYDLSFIQPSVSERRA